MLRGLLFKRPRLVRPVFYGWVLTWLLGPTQLVTWGVVYYTFSVLLTPMRAAMGWSSAQVTGAFSLGVLVSGASSVLVGQWLDQRGPRLLMIGGVCLATLLVGAWSQVRSLAGLYAVWIGLGLVTPAVTYDPAFWVVTRWFLGDQASARNRAMTVLTLFGGLASTAFIPIATALHMAFGWRTALQMLAVLLAACTLVPYGLLLKGRPPPLGPISAQHAPVGLGWNQVLRGGAFWSLTLPLMLTSGAWSALTVHFVSYALSRQIGAALVATAAALVGVLQVVGRLGIVPLGDRFPARRLTAVLCGFQAAAMVSLLVLPSPAGLIGYAVCFGIGHGVMTPMRVTLIADAFGVGRYGTLAGAIKLITTLASALAPVAVGMLVTSTGSYTTALIVIMSFSLVAGALLLRPAAAGTDKMVA